MYIIYIITFQNWAIVHRVRLIILRTDRYFQIPMPS